MPSSRVYLRRIPRRPIRPIINKFAEMSQVGPSCCTVQQPLEADANTRSMHVSLALQMHGQSKRAADASERRSQLIATGDGILQSSSSSSRMGE